MAHLPAVVREVQAVGASVTARKGPQRAMVPIRAVSRGDGLMQHDGGNPAGIAKFAGEKPKQIKQVARLRNFVSTRVA